ncbi:MAG: hypothetical protein IJV01_03485 [Bacteroidales bacterium]|nr:hypothetical protein [Bacteroidales bacterium]
MAFAIEEHAACGAGKLAPQSDVVAQVLERMEKARVEFDYRFETEGNVPLKGNGHAVLEGKCYRVEGNGLVICCDGTTRWTSDPKAREVYVENTGREDALLERPEEFLRSVRGLRYDGRSLSGTLERPGDAVSIRCYLDNIVTEPAARNAAPQYRLDTAALGKDWIVTDLR